MDPLGLAAENGGDTSIDPKKSESKEKELLEVKVKQNAFNIYLLKLKTIKEDKNLTFFQKERARTKAMNEFLKVTGIKGLDRANQIFGGIRMGFISKLDILDHRTQIKIFKGIFKSNKEIHSESKVIKNI